jgi:hypothetical protein
MDNLHSPLLVADRTGDRVSFALRLVIASVTSPLQSPRMACSVRVSVAQKFSRKFPETERLQRLPGAGSEHRER